MNAEIKLAKSSDFDEVKIDKKCTQCTQSICCNSINQKIPTPKTREDFDHLLWLQPAVFPFPFLWRLY